MLCKRCGSRLPDEAAFCPACGAQAPHDAITSAGTWFEEGAAPAVCASCGSRSIRIVRKGEYLCEYCGSRFFAKGQDVAASEEDVTAELMALFEEAAKYESRDQISSELRVLVWTSPPKTVPCC